MAKYTVLKNEQGNGYDVIEQADKLKIQTWADSKAARDQAKQLNDGMGFAGFTPPFFLATYPTMRALS